MGKSKVVMSRQFKQITLVLACTLVGIGCSTTHATVADAGTNCLSSPTLCAEGQTCWPTSDSTFGCVPSAEGIEFGASCVEKISVATCGDGMLCDATNPDGEGQCTDYCETAASCPSGFVCVSTTIAGSGGAAIWICRVAPIAASGDSGSPEKLEDGGVVYPDAEITLSDDASTDAAPLQQ